MLLVMKSNAHLWGDFPQSCLRAFVLLLQIEWGFAPNGGRVPFFGRRSLFLW